MPQSMGWCRWGVVVGSVGARLGAFATVATMGCTAAATKDPALASPIHHPEVTALDARPSPPAACETPRCAGADEQQAPGEHAHHALAPYEPERFEPGAELSAEDALRILGAFEPSSSGRDPACARLQAPIARTCDDSGPEMLALVARPSKYRPFKAAFEETHKLAKVEGCTVLPTGAMRWIRARRLSECAPELVSSALQKGRPDLDPKVRGLLVGEAIAGQCLRQVEPVPPFRGKFTPERFARWRTSHLAAWHERNVERLDECRDAATSIPVGVPGRTSAMIGYAQAVAKFMMAHRLAPMDKVLAQDDDARMAFFAANDDANAPFRARREAANEEARREAAREGAYEDYVRAFDSLTPSQKPLSLLALPPLPPVTSARNQWMLSRLPVQLTPVGPVASMCGSGDYSGAQQSIAALLRRGLPLELRSRVGTELAQMPASDEARQRLHLLLASGLLRLGLVTQDRVVIERADYEVRYAGTGAAQSWLAALTRAILTPAMAQVLLPKFAPTVPSSERGEPDLSGFTPELLELSASHPEYADIGVDWALLGSVGPTFDHYLRFGDKAVELSDRPGVSVALVACVNRHFGICDLEFVEDNGRTPCDCTPFPWRVEERGL